MEFINKKKDLTQAQVDRKNKLKALLADLHQGLDEETARQRFLKDFGSVTAQELSEAEDQLIQEGTPVEEIRSLCNVHAGVFQDGIAILDKDRLKEEVQNIPGHPAFIFRMENEGLKRFIEEEFKPAVKAMRDSGETDEVLLKLHELAKVKEHYSRKENVFFPHLEKLGVSGPPQVMWGVDDEIREGLRRMKILLEKQRANEAIPTIHETVQNILGMITKENNILMPMMTERFDEATWQKIAQDSQDFKTIFCHEIEGAAPSDGVTWLQAQQGNEANVNVQTNGEINLPSGHFSQAELTAMLNTMPSEITFIGADDRVRYFNEDGKKKLFPRTRSIIGREVYNCHPPKSVPIVRQLIADFKSGAKDKEVVAFRKGEALILVRYLAVRDEAGSYLGTLETVEDIADYPTMDEAPTGRPKTSY